MVPKDTQNMCDVTNDLGPVGIPKNTRKTPNQCHQGPVFQKIPVTFRALNPYWNQNLKRKSADPCLQTKKRDFKSSTQWSLVTKYVALAWLL